MEQEARKTILAIDDNPTQLKIFEKMLNTDFDLYLIKSAPEAMELMSSRKFDLILLDIEMPDVSGFEFLHEIRKKAKYMTTPVIIVSSHSDENFLTHAKHSSASDVLTKPVEKEQLMDTIKRAFSTPINDPFHLKE